MTSHPATDWRAVWSPDGMSIAFASDRNGRSSLFRKRAEPTAAEEPLLEAAAGGGRFISDWSADGRFVIFHQDVQRETVSTDVWALPLSGDRKPFPMVETRFREAGARVSPNGRWLAYVSDESGRDEVYVKAFETPDARRISPSGARNAVWRRDGRELFFLGFDYLVMAVTWDDNAGAPAGMPRPLFRICDDLPVAASYGDRFDVTSDGQRFLVTCRSGNAPAPAITVIVNWRGMLENRTR